MERSGKHQDVWAASIYQALSPFPCSLAQVAFACKSIRDQFCCSSAKYHPPFAPLFPSPFVFQSISCPRAEAEMLFFQLCGIWRNALAFMLQTFFRFPAKDSNIFYVCVGVRNICVMLYKVYKGLSAHLLLPPCGCLCTATGVQPPLCCLRSADS